ncbi:zinc-dependent alcohol dehydrogenase family protein [Rhizobacter sp. J219]|uniref:zinc-dependent alcohol dehydrogenase family protein n=1 Tax=Rhizobacter sp. J219 TaxID=2898430 RepID=UPI002151DA9D|nr:zinc-dependent alcohol dehydrogenase family protein [Rhizobacter sp. J219]MCR5886023.1 zinc-dependent alcohol dehydrogenase family protein [Rhizobacter sp. J219]
MRAMVYRGGGRALALESWPLPEPGRGEMRIKVLACGVCRTDLHIVDGELPLHGDHVIPGHEVVGEVECLGDGVTGHRLGERVGVPWLGWTCGECEHCTHGRENLCGRALFTGHTRDGGYASHIVVKSDYAIPLPDAADPLRTAPLMCAGLIGWRALRAAGDARVIGLYGFGASAHLVAQVAIAQGRMVFAMTRPGDTRRQQFARSLGATWAGGTDATPPQPLDAAILFAPDGALVPLALSHVRPGGTVVCAGIHMSDIPSFPYATLWGERTLRSVANLTRADATGFFAFVHDHPLQVEVTPYPLAQANEALDALRAGRLQGAAVLVP